VETEAIPRDATPIVIAVVAMITRSIRPMRSIWCLQSTLSLGRRYGRRGAATSERTRDFGTG